jgi:NAD(P)-dependent dehydrogenase (short-subunit alcohol dehydrogenase family)
MVNVLAPFIITYNVLSKLNPQPKRILITASGAHQGRSVDLDSLDNQTNFKKDWVAFNSYSDSKLLVIMLSRAFYY